MKRPNDKDVDYEPDIQMLQQVWRDPKEETRTGTGFEGHYKKRKQVLPSAMTTKKTISVEKGNSKPSKLSPAQKGKKVVMSKPNMSQVRNPRPDPYEVIEVVTRPDKFYEDPLRNYKNNIVRSELILTNPEKYHLGESYALREILKERDHELSMLRVSNTHNEDKIKRLYSQIEAKDELIDELRSRERQLLLHASTLSSKYFNFNYGKVYYENFKSDSRRLLKMLKNTAEYRTFAYFALDDDGVRYLNSVSKTVKTKLDVPEGQTIVHYCTCSKAFIPEAALWVPEKAYEYGRQFIKDRNGDLSQSYFELLLYELNKIWRYREKRIVNSVNALKTNYVGKYKRKLNNLSKYKEIVSRE